MTKMFEIAKEKDNGFYELYKNCARTYDCRELTVRDTADTILDRMNQIFELW